MSSNDSTQVLSSAEALPQAFETFDFDFAAFVLTAYASTKLAAMTQHEKKQGNPGLGYKFRFAITGLPIPEFERLEMQYVNHACSVEPVMYMQRRASLRSVMDRRIRLAEFNNHKDARR